MRPYYLALAPQNFFASEGMPYPSWYTDDLWKAKQASGDFVDTDCPPSSSGIAHPGSMCE